MMDQIIAASLVAALAGGALFAGVDARETARQFSVPAPSEPLERTGARREGSTPTGAAQPVPGPHEISPGRELFTSERPERTLPDLVSLGAVLRDR